MSLGDRLGIAGLIVGVIAIAVPFLWPTKKWIGKLSLAVAGALVVGWGVLEYWAKPEMQPAQSASTAQASTSTPASAATADQPTVHLAPEPSGSSAGTSGKKTIQSTAVSHGNQSPSVGTIAQGPCAVLQIGGVGNQATGGSCEPPSRVLTGVQDEVLKSALSPITARAIVWYFGNDSDTTRLATAIYRDLQKAGWEMDKGNPEPAIPTEPFEYDVAVFTPGQQGDAVSAAADEIVKALQLSSMPHLVVGSSWSDKIPVGSVKIVIGPRWAK